MRSPIAKLSVAQLVDTFAAKSTEQEDAIIIGETRTANRLYDQLQAVEDELKSRPGDERRALLTLYKHGNMQVRLNAAKATLALEPELGRQALQAIKDSGWPPQNADAGMSLWNLDQGIYKPT